MIENARVLQDNEFFFVILISSASEYFGMDNMQNLILSFPESIEVIALQEGKSISRIYCIGNNQLDVLQLDTKFDLLVKLI